MLRLYLEWIVWEQRYFGYVRFVWKLGCEWLLGLVRFFGFEALGKWIGVER
jgi:hypothetical protein